MIYLGSYDCVYRFVKIFHTKQHEFLFCSYVCIFYCKCSQNFLGNSWPLNVLIMTVNLQMQMKSFYKLK